MALESVSGNFRVLLLWINLEPARIHQLTTPLIKVFVSSCHAYRQDETHTLRLLNRRQTDVMLTKIFRVKEPTLNLKIKTTQNLGLSFLCKPFLLLKPFLSKACMQTQISISKSHIFCGSVRIHYVSKTKKNIAKCLWIEERFCKLHPFCKTFWL